MATRNFIQRGVAYGSDSLKITAKIDGNTVANSAIVPTVESPLVLGAANLERDDVIFSWTNPTEFDGQQTLEITVTGGPGYVVLTQALADKQVMIGPGVIAQTAPPPENNPNPPDPETDYLAFHNAMVETGVSNQCLSDVMIDGVAKQPSAAALGQWHYVIPSGSTMTAKYNVTASVVISE